MFKIIEDNFDDILFENKEKNYGAYYLRKNYSRYVTIGGGITFSVFLLLFCFWYYVEQISRPIQEVEVEQDLIFTEFDYSLPPLPLDKLTPRLTKAGNPVPVEDKIPKVVKDELVKETKLMDNTVKTENKIIQDTSSRIGNDKNGTDSTTSKGLSNTGDTSRTSIEVEPIGGIAEFILYVQKNIKYPEEAKRYNISGTIYVFFNINEEGKIMDLRVTKPLGFGIDEEVLSVIKSAPSWKPYRVNGIAQKQPVHAPIRLNLPK